MNGPEEMQRLIRLAEVTYDQKTKCDHLLAAARIAENELGDTAAAMDTYRSVLAIDENHTVALEAMSELCVRNGEHTMLVVLLERRATMETDSTKRAALIDEMSSVYLDALNDERGVESAKERIAGR